MNPTLITWLVMIAVILFWVGVNFGKDILKFYKEYKEKLKGSIRSHKREIKKIKLLKAKRKK